MVWRTNKKTGKPFQIRSNGIPDVHFAKESQGKIVHKYRHSQLLIRKKTDHLILSRNSYSFHLKHDQNIPYHLEVQHDGKPLFSIPLKPILSRGISYLLQMHGIPIDAELLVEAWDKTMTFYNETQN